jgi:hypothetical protein
MERRPSALGSREYARPRTEGTPSPLRLPTFATVQFVWRRGEGFEPPTQLPVYRTEARCLKPLSHLSATGGGLTTKYTRRSQNPKTPRWFAAPRDRLMKRVPAAFGRLAGTEVEPIPIDAKSAECLNGAIVRAVPTHPTPRTGDARRADRHQRKAPAVVALGLG